MSYDNTNRAVLFRNDNKKTETHPDYSGNLNFEGVECFLDAWIKTSESGKKFMSLSLKRKEKQPEQSKASFQNTNQTNGQNDSRNRQFPDRKSSGGSRDSEDVPF